MDRVGASSEATLKVNIHFEVINNEGKVSVLEGTGIFIPEIKCRLLSPQDRFMELHILENTEGPFNVTWDKSILKISDQVPIIINYEQKTHFTMLHAYKSIYSTEEYLAMTGYVTSDKNHKLTHLRNILLPWNFKIGHTGFYTVQMKWKERLSGKYGKEDGK